MSTSETPTPLLPELPRPDESRGVVGLLLRLIEQRYGNDQAERETYRVIAGKTIERLADAATGVTGRTVGSFKGAICLATPPNR